MRPFPKGYEALYAIAVEAGLDYPEGRALYALNRVQMGWPRTPGGLSMRTEIDVLRRAYPDTAKRWHLHWLAGGSIRSIKLTAEEYRKQERERRAQKKAHLAGREP